jgi:hypothetical protein
MTLISIAIALFLILRAIQYQYWRITFKRFTDSNACLSPRIMPYSSKIRRFKKLSDENKNTDIIDNYFLQKYHTHGMTHAAGSVLDKRVKALYTAEPDNFKAVFSTKFHDWSRSTVWANAMKHFLKPGILTAVSRAI